MIFKFVSQDKNLIQTINFNEIKETTCFTNKAIVKDADK